MSQFSSFRIIRVTLAFAVALWMAGAGCLLGCEKGVAAASNGLNQPVNSLASLAIGETCAKHGAVSKHKANAKKVSNAKYVSTSPSAESSFKSKTTKQSAANSLTLAFEAGRSSMMDCPLAVNTTAALSKAGSDSANAQFALANVNQPPADSLEQIATLAPPPRLPNRGHTYLRCCVFLI